MPSLRGDVPRASSDRAIGRQPRAKPKSTPPPLRRPLSPALSPKGKREKGKKTGLTRRHKGHKENRDGEKAGNHKGCPYKCNNGVPRAGCPRSGGKQVRGLEKTARFYGPFLLILIT